MREVKEIMDIKVVVKELATECADINKMEMEFKMKVGKYDEKVNQLITELGMDPKVHFNIIEVLKAAFDKQSPLIL